MMLLTSGSPFSLYLGIEKPPERKDSKSKKKKSSNRENKDPKVGLTVRLLMHNFDTL